MAESKVATLEGNELADDYVRTHLPKGRWADTWELFKNSFLKLVIINMFTLLFMVPGIAVVYLRNVYVTQMGLTFPFSSNPLFTYPLTPSMQGAPENIVLTANLMFFSLLIAAGFIASVGIAGACYSIKKLINTHGQFTVKGYFHGVKVCYFKVLLPVTIFLIFIFGSFTLSAWSDALIAKGAGKGGPITAQVFIIIATVTVGIICAWLLAVGVSYKIKLKQLFKNSLVLLFSTVVQTVFMIGFSLIPVWLLLIGLSSTFFQVIGYAIFIFFGFSYIILCWLAYTQWVFDMFITPDVKSQEEAKKSTLTPKQLAEEAETAEKNIARELLAAGRSELVGRPVRPIAGGTVVKEVGVAFGRADMERVLGDRQKIQAELDEYYEQHKKDTRYVEYEKLFAEREKVLKSPKDKKNKGKQLSRNNLLSR